MKTADTPERVHRRFRARLTAALLAACALAPLLGTGSAQAGPGGAASIVPGESSAGLAFSPWRYAGATWYGPGLYGRHTACGQTLRRATLGVAHRSLPCGTAVKFFFHGRQIVTRIIDRGPYSKGNSWDLTSAAAEALGFSSTGRAKIRYSVAVNYARP
jgi:peptidoglycan lytic transglycosylase